MNAMIKLFKAVIVKNSKLKKKASKALLQETIQKGFIFAPNVIANYSEKELLELAKTIGLSSAEMNSSFHKSWTKIKNASVEQLVFEQLVHYFTTYGFEAMLDD